MLLLSGVKKKYGRTLALANASYDFPATGLFCLYGPNGSGKSTLFKLIAGLEKQTKGRISILGNDKSSVKRKDVTFVRSYFNLDDKATCKENLILPYSSVDEGKARDILNELGIASLLNVKCRSFSEGEKRRLTLARGLLSTSPILLLDEPFASVDELNKTKIASLLEKEGKSRLVIFSSNRKEDFKRAPLSGLLSLTEAVQTIQSKKAEKEIPTIFSDNRLKPFGLFAKLFRHRWAWLAVSFSLTLGLSLSAFLFLPSGLNEETNGSWERKAEFAFCEANFESIPISRVSFDPNDGIVHYKSNLEGRKEAYHVSDCSLPLYSGYPYFVSDNYLSKAFLGSEVHQIHYFLPTDIASAGISLSFGSLPTSSTELLISSFNCEEMVATGTLKNEKDALSLVLDDFFSGKKYSVSGVYRSNNAIFNNSNLSSFCANNFPLCLALLSGRCDAISVSKNPENEDSSSLYIPMSAISYPDVDDYIIPQFMQRPTDVSDYEDSFPFLNVASSIKEKNRMLGWSLFYASLVAGLFSFVLLSFSLERRKRALLAVSSSKYLSIGHFFVVGSASFLMPEVIGMAFAPVGLSMANEALRSAYWTVVTAGAFIFPDIAWQIVGGVIAGSLLLFEIFTLSFLRKNIRLI